MSKYLKVLIGLAVVALLASVVAISVVSADTPTPTPQNGSNTFYSNFIDKLASHLGKTPQETKDAITQTQKDLVNDALNQGKITQQQADAANKRIDNGGFGFGFGFMGRGFGKGDRPGFGKGMVRGFGLNSVATFLGITQQDLMTQLKSGKSLAQIAQDHGKTREQLKDAIVSNAKDSLNKAVTNGKLTQDKADAALKKLQGNLDKMIDQTHQARNNRPTGNWRQPRGNGQNS